MSTQLIAIKPSKKASAKGKKNGRNKKKCERYRMEGRKEKNKVLKKARSIKREAKLQRLRDKRKNKAA